MGPDGAESHESGGMMTSDGWDLTVLSHTGWDGMFSPTSLVDSAFEQLINPIVNQRSAQTNQNINSMIKLKKLGISIGQC